MFNKEQYVCPLCNGLETLSHSCPQCGVILEDYGPVFFLFHDYSPYQPIESYKRDDGWDDLHSHRCPHQFFCPDCGFTDLYMIQEKSFFS